MPTLIDPRPAGVLADVPHDPAAERALLTALLADRDAIIHVAPRLTPDHFFDPAHAAIYRAILTLYTQRRPPDLVTVPAWLADAGLLPVAGGVEYLSELFCGYRPAIGVHLQYYAEIIAAHAQQRLRIAVATELGALGYRRDLDAAAVAAEQARILARLWAHEPVHGAALGAVLDAVMDALVVQQRTGAAPGLPTGFPSLDAVIYGWEPGTTNLLYALTSAGKTALALHFARHAAVEARVPVLILSLEMDSAQIGRRLLAMEGSTDLGLLRTAALGEHDWQRLTDAAARLTSGAPITLLDSGITTVAALQAEVQRAQADPAQGCGLVIVDYLQLLEHPGARGGNRETEVAGASRALKRLARQCAVPVLVLGQFNDGAEGSEAPQLRDLRESRAPGMDATVVLALHRPDPVQRPTRVDLHVLKNRDGARDVRIALQWTGRLQQFQEVSA